MTYFAVCCISSSALYLCQNVGCGAWSGTGFTVVQPSSTSGLFLAAGIAGDGLAIAPESDGVVTTPAIDSKPCARASSSAALAILRRLMEA